MNSDDSDLVNVCIVSKHGQPTRMRALWRLTRADAKKLCSDSRTAGRNFMLIWTTRHIDDLDAYTWVTDTGSFDAVLAEYGVTPLPRPSRRRKP